MEYSQKRFIKTLMKSGQSVTVFLTNGVKLQGKIVSVDTTGDLTCLYLTRDGVTQLVYTHGISTIMPPEGIEFNMEFNF